jgi:hypothetical protein
MSNIYFGQALYKLYPQIVRTVADEAFDAEGNLVAYDPVAVNEEAQKLDCKAQAVQILNETDWASIGDVGNPQMSNPYLVNQAAFISYRSQVRALAVNPVANPVFPTQPNAQWSS